MTIAARPLGHRARPTIVLVCLATTGVLALLVHPFDPDRECCDHLAYRSMSYNLFTITRPDLNVPPPGNEAFDMGVATEHIRYGLNHLPPFVYRVVTPLLARSIAYVTGIDAAYYLISFFALAAAAIFIGLSILELSESIIPALAGAVVFLVNPYTVRYNLWDYMLTDPMAFFLAALAIWALVKRNRTLFFAACAVGVLNKGTMLPMLVAYPLSEAWLDRHIRRSSITAVVGILAGYYLFRVAMPEALPDYTLSTQAGAALANVRVGLMVTAGITVFGVMVPASLRRPWHSGLMIALVPFAAFAVLGTLPRHQVQALPAVCLGMFWRWPTMRRERLLLLAVVPLAILSAVVYSNGLPGWFQIRHLENPTRVIESLVLVAAAVEVWLWRLQRDSAALGQKTYPLGATGGHLRPDPSVGLPHPSRGPE